MNSFMVFALVVSGAGVAFGRPQDRAGQYSTGGGLSVTCKDSEVSPGVYKFECIGVDPARITLSSEHILWLKAGGGQDQTLDISVPNYRVEELIRAALKAGSGGSTNINILLRKPETVYDVQAQDGGNVVLNKPSVSLQYEDVPKPSSKHYPTDQAYNPLSGPIREP